ncbi:hypothetical protein B0H16DRAFT_370500 [Mycena metata]|uniref:Uncharacterized protein n=1 Tax=Mycena metata TaxID=1033252 RepID=A0AAD7JKC8_9AGAR|nr:hypothetical protein B0H16DRAFT_370500 [Mycena metata]
MLMLDLCLHLFDAESVISPLCSTRSYSPSNDSSTTTYPSDMARGLNNKDISTDTKQNVIHIHLDDPSRKQRHIARDLRISISSVEKILRRYRLDSQGFHAPPTARVRGRPRTLRAANVDASLHFFQVATRAHCFPVHHWLDTKDPRHLLA